ncbi:MAG: hypothetical protein RL172_1579 [Bacteroidota bacterium]|jgi:hypothetical protein
MKKLFAKTWFRIIFLGLLVGAVLIIADEKMQLFDKKTPTQTDTYNGPVTAQKSEVYFTQVKLSASNYNFGKVKEGDTVMHAFTLTNTGAEPLFIYKAAGSCDCVASDYSKEMVPPGALTTVKVYFNTKGRNGKQNRTVTLTCNTDPADIVLNIAGEVE